MPDITRTVHFSADESGVSVDGTRFGWDRVVNEYGESAEDENFAPGVWGFNYAGTDVSFYVPNDYPTKSGFIKAINGLTTSAKETYTWNSVYDHAEKEGAVTAEFPTFTLTMNNDLAKEIMIPGGPDYHFVADANGIAIAYHKDETNTDVVICKKTWKEMEVDDSAIDDPADGITVDQKWNSGNKIETGKTYRYSFQFDGSDSPSGETRNLSFTLSNVTSLDSVIDGLNGVKIQLSGENIDYRTTVTKKDGDDKLLSLASSQSIIPHITPSLQEEIDLGRDFTIDNGYDKSGIVTVDNNRTGATLAFSNKDDSSKAGITLNADLSGAVDTVKQKLATYYTTMEQLAAYAAIAGRENKLSTDLATIVQDGNITKTGHFSETENLSTYTNRSSGCTTVLDDTTMYHGAKINFKGVQSVYDLAGSGFDSTCATCDRHYSIKFTIGGSGDGYTTGAHGYRFRETEDNQNEVYLLEVDLSSLVENNVTISGNGEGETSFASALVDVIHDSGFDKIHYQQYASKETELFVFDERGEGIPESNAKFYTKPFDPASIIDFHTSFENADGDYVDANYTYDFSDTQNSIQAKMKETDDTSDAGKKYFVKTSDGTYHVADAAELADASAMKYTVEFEYTLSDGTTSTDRNQAIEDAAKTGIKSAVEHTDVHLQSVTKTTVDVSAVQNDNTAVRPLFENEIIIKGDDGRIPIQHSAAVGDRTFISRYPMNTGILGIYSAKVDTLEHAHKAVDKVDHAINLVSEKRALYGVQQNRLEHSYNNNRVTTENVTASESRIRDTDMAQEIAAYTKNNVLLQSAQAMLSQANQVPQGVMQLLQQT